MWENPFTIGDWVTFDNNDRMDGYIVNVSLSSTQVRTWDNGLLTIPNKKVVNMPLLNWSRRRTGRQIKLFLGFTYQSKNEDLVNMKKDIIKLLEDNPDMATPSMKVKSLDRKKQAKLISRSDELGIKNNLYVNIINFDTSAITMMVYAYTKTIEWGKHMDVKEQVILDIKALAKKNNLEFAYPTQSIFIENADKV